MSVKKVLITILVLSADRAGIMKDLAWKWLFWQVFAPIVGPIVISASFALLWSTGARNFTINWHLLIEDVTPWALTFYAMALIGASMNDLWPKFGNHQVLATSLLLTALAVSLYAAFIVIWRHDSSFRAGAPVYVVTFILLGISVYLCHKVAKLG